jgi:formylmethanofuran dehydrogenase subunit E
LKPEILSQDEDHVALFVKMRSETASPEETKDFRALHEAKSQRVLEMQEEKLFWVREMEIKPPEKAIIYSTLICSKCGEGFMESLGRVRNGKIVCIPCFEVKDE